jgi:hypothetical protein
MNPEYRKRQEQWDKFNAWEDEQDVKLSMEERLKQFCLLADLALTLPEDVKEEMHREHLENLIEIQKSVRIVYNKLSALSGQHSAKHDFADR